jgi:hypothetical protein
LAWMFFSRHETIHLQSKNCIILSLDDRKKEKCSFNII